MATRIFESETIGKRKIMNWGMIGEIAGAFTVVLTLAYLAVEVRHAKAAALAPIWVNHYRLRP